MKSTNSKVNRMLDAIACELQGLPDETIARIHDIIDDDRDGYTFDFNVTVLRYRLFTHASHCRGR